MNTTQIHRALESNSITSSIFGGVYAADAVPPLDTFPQGYVVNTDPTGAPGSHWVTLYTEKSVIVETFDSFGKDLNSYSPFFHELGENNRLITQSQQLQSELSTVCGQYCIFFLLRRASGETYSYIVHLFTDHKISNDIMVCQYVNHHFDMHTEVQDQRFVNQIAKTLQ